MAPTLPYTGRLKTWSSLTTKAETNVKSMHFCDFRKSKTLSAKNFRSRRNACSPDSDNDEETDAERTWKQRKSIPKSSKRMTVAKTKTLSEFPRQFMIDMTTSSDENEDDYEDDNNNKIEKKQTAETKRAMRNRDRELSRFTDMDFELPCQVRWRSVYFHFHFLFQYKQI